MILDFKFLNHSALPAFVLLVIFFALVSPFSVGAQNNNDYGLIPCGFEEQAPCELKHLVDLADKVITFLLLGLAMPLAVAALVYAGILLMSAGGDQSKLERGKSVFYYTIIGFVLAFGAWLIVKLIVTGLARRKAQKAIGKYLQF